jgi:hypothetical protein
LRKALMSQTGHGVAGTSNLLRIWVQKYETGGLDDDAAAADRIQEYEARSAALYPNDLYRAHVITETFVAWCRPECGWNSVWRDLR